MKNKLLVLLLLLCSIFLLIKNTQAQTNNKKILEIPYFTQENGPDCWAASSLMISNATSPHTNNNVLRVIRNVGEMDGIGVRALEGHQEYINEINRLTGVNPHIETYWSGTNLQSSILTRIKNNINNNRPVLFFSTKSVNGTSGGHAVVIVGYDGDDYLYIHDPRGLSNYVRKRIPLNKIFSSNASYSLATIPKALATNRNLLSAVINKGAINFMQPKLANNSKNTSSIIFTPDRNIDKLYRFNGNLNSNGNIPGGYNVVTFGKGSAFLIANAANSIKTARVVIKIHRKDKSKKLKTLDFVKTIMPHSIETLQGKLNEHLSLVELRDEKDPVPCEIEISYTNQDNGKLFHKQVIEFTLEPFKNEINITTDKKEKNKVTFTVSSDNLPANAKYYYKFKKVSGKVIEKIDTSDNPYEHSFLYPNKYQVLVDIKYLSRGYDDKDKNKRVTKETNFGNAETFITIEEYATITSSQNKDNWTFKLIADIPYDSVKWAKKEKTQTSYSPISQTGNEIKETITQGGDYTLQAKLYDASNKLIGLAQTDITVQGQQKGNDIEAAYKARDWKKLFELLQKTQKETEIKQIQKYLKLIADEKYITIKQYLDKMLAYQKTETASYDKYKTTAASEAEKYRKSKNMDAARKIEQCMNDSYNKYQKQKDLIEYDINFLTQLADNYNYYQVDYPQEDFFKSCDEINLGLNFDPTKPLKTTNFKTYCSNKDAIKADKKTQVILKATKLDPAVGEVVPVLAKLQMPAHAIMCPDEEEYTWEGNHAGEGSQVEFMASKAGSHKLGVTVSCMDQVIGSDSITFKIGGGGIEAKITGLQETQVYFGSSKDIELDSTKLKSTITGLDKDVVVQWHSTPNLKFESPDSIATKVTFNKYGTVKIFAKILKKENGTLKTIGESNLVEVNVISPEFQIKFAPTQDQGEVGKAVTARIISQPYVTEEYIDYRWVEPTDRKEIGKDTIEFVPKSSKPIKFNIIARVPISGQTIKDTIKATYTPGEYEVIVKLIGPKYDKDSQEWSAKDKGLVTKKPALVTGQHIEVGVEVKNFKGDTTYDWKANDGCSVLSGNTGKVLTVSRNEPGSCSLNVIAYNKNKNRLGEGELSFDINQQGSSTEEPEINKPEKDPDKEKKKKQQQAQQAIKEAKESASQGNFDQAIKKAEEAVSQDPENVDLKKELENIKKEKEKFNSTTQKVKEQLSNEDFEAAQQTIKDIKTKYPNNPISKELENSYTATKKKFIEKVSTTSKANVRKGDLETAIKDLEKASKVAPENTTIKEELTKIKANKEKLDNLNKQFETAMANKDYKKADDLLNEMKKINTYYPKTQDAHSELAQIGGQKRQELANKLHEINSLEGKGEVEQAISSLETLIVEAQKVDHAENILSDAKSKLNYLKNKKNIADQSITGAEKLISEKYYDNAKSLIDNALRAVPNYKPALILKEKLDQLLQAKQNALDKQKELSDKAFEESRACNHDEAIKLIAEAKELNPDDTTISRYNYEINNKKKIFIQDLERSKLYLDRGDIEFAKQELEKHATNCSNNSKFIEAQSLIENYYKEKDNKIQAKIAELKALFEAKEYTKTVNLAKEITKTLQPTRAQIEEINSVEIPAHKKLSDKKGAINYIRIAQTHFAQNSYEGCLKQLEVLENQYPDCWEPSDQWPDIIAKLKNDAQNALNNHSDKAYEELQIAENLYNNNKVKDAITKFEGTFDFYNKDLNPSDPRYKHYQNVYNQALKCMEQFKAIEAEYKDVFDTLSGQFDINKINRKFAQRVRELSNKMLSILPNKEGAGQTDVKKLFDAANKFDKAINELVDACKQIALTPDKANTKKICTQAHNMDPENPEVIAILENYNRIISKYPEDQYQQPTKPVKVFDNGNVAGCGYTDTARFNLKTRSNLKEIKLWYNWQSGQNSLKYRLFGPMGQVKSGSMVRGNCDPYQQKWCHAVASINKSVNAGNYTVKVANGRICQNSGTRGNGTIRVFATPQGSHSSSSTVPTAIQSTSNSSSGYNGTCKFYSGKGNCKINLKRSGNKVTGSLNANIEGDNVSASISGQLSPNSNNAIPLKANIYNGKIVDNTIHKTVTFTGKMTGNLYKSTGKASGNFSLKLTGMGGGPGGSWKAQLGSSGTSSTKNTSSQSKYKIVYIVFKNQSSMPVHFYSGGGCSPHNKVMPGGSKNLNVKMGIPVTRYNVGRNGKTLVYKDLHRDSIQNGQTVTFIYNQSGWLTMQK